MRVIRRTLRGLGKTLLVLGALLLLAVAAAAVKIVAYDQREDTLHLQGKQEYLERIRAAGADARQARPNIVLVLYDDLGYADFGVTGSGAIATPHIDALAHAGVTLNHFYAPAPVCTPSRFGMLTGRFAERGGLSHVVFPAAHPLNWYQRLRGMNVRMPADEITLAEILRAADYRTGMIGKWHLGDHSPSLPNDLGFEQFFGALYSNDMTPFALYRDRRIEIPPPADQDTLSDRYTGEAERFIAQHAREPFFLYLAHNSPHLPLHVRDARRGRSQAGLYGDVVEELDEGIGRLVAALKTAGVYENTLVVITSDNGPWFQGSPGLARGRKGETFDGGMHVPFVAAWPAALCHGCLRDGMAMGTDILPTVLDLLGLPEPADRVLDGRSLLPMLRDGAAGPHRYLYYFSGELYGVRDARFKFMPRRSINYATAGALAGAPIPQGPFLFDLLADPDEAYDTSDRYPEDMRRLQRAHEAAVAAMRADPFGGRAAR